MKQIIPIILILIGSILSGYSQESNIKLKYDKSGNVKYITFDEENKTGNWDCPTSPEAFWKDILNIKEKNQFVTKKN